MDIGGGGVISRGVTGLYRLAALQIPHTVYLLIMGGSLEGSKLLFTR